MLQFIPILFSGRSYFQRLIERSAFFCAFACVLRLRCGRSSNMFGSFGFGELVTIVELRFNRKAEFGVTGCMVKLMFNNKKVPAVELILLWVHVKLLICLM
jgi:hypothetical protein